VYKLLEILNQRDSLAVAGWWWLFTNTTQMQARKQIRTNLVAKQRHLFKQGLYHQSTMLDGIIRLFVQHESNNPLTVITP